MSTPFDPQSYCPRDVFGFFAEISAVPRASGSEGAAADYLERFAKDRGLECIRDASDNVFMRRQPSPGYETRPYVLLQCHTDMVCEKNAGTEHDFSSDPIKLFVSDGRITAKGTTLGADDGIGVAMALAALDSEGPSRGIEALFTSGEEIGLVGAKKFDYGPVRSRFMINLDGETDGKAIIGCAGGARNTAELEYDTVPAANRPIKITVKGCAGGHSGTDIHLGRANAIRIMGRLMNSLYEIEPFNLISVSGGMKSNAIPRECEAKIAVFDVDKTAEHILSLEKLIKNELTADDKNFRVYVDRCARPETMLTLRDTSRLISLIVLSPGGVLSANSSFTESSSNLGVIETAGDVIRLQFESRSCVESLLDDICLRFDRLANVLGVKIVHGSRYPAWRVKKDTPLQRLYLQACREVYSGGGDSGGGKEFVPELIAIHAGVECGVISAGLPGLDIIAIGPDIAGAHTPWESLDIASCGRTWLVLRQMIASL